MDDDQPSTGVARAAFQITLGAAAPEARGLSEGPTGPV